MIYTLTLNPSIDYMVSVDDFTLGSVNRVTHEYILPGGKGINVSIVLNNLGIENKALGFVSGFTGQEIEKLVRQHQRVTTDFIDVKNGYSRINLKMKSNEESEINGTGPNITKEHIQSLFKKFDDLKDGDIVILSGSIPQSVSQHIYSDIMQYLANKNIEIVVDATGKLLMNVLEHKPFLIKPNHHELAEMFHVKLSNNDDIIKYAKKLQSLGAKNVLISMAGDGAIFVCENGQILRSEAPKGIVKNSVGAGDSMVAGFVTGYIKNNNYIDAFKMGVATGSASAFSEDLATEKEVEELLKNIKITEYK